MSDRQTFTFERDRPETWLAGIEWAKATSDRAENRATAERMIAAAARAPGRPAHEALLRQVAVLVDARKARTRTQACEQVLVEAYGSAAVTTTMVNTLLQQFCRWRKKFADTGDVSAQTSGTMSA